MSMMVRSEGNSEIKQLEPGVYTGIATAIIDLGIQENMTYGKQQRKAIIVWNVVGETVKVNDEELPRVISKEYTMSLGEKSTLRKDLEAWRGRPFTTEELQGFDLKNILNVPCQLQINQQEKNGKTYTNIAAIMSIPKGMSVAPVDNVYIFDTYDLTTWENYDKIANWIKEKKKKAMNIDKKEQEGKKQEETEEDIEIPKDDLPF